MTGEDDTAGRPEFSFTRGWWLVTTVGAFLLGMGGLISLAVMILRSTFIGRSFLVMIVLGSIWFAVASRYRVRRLRVLPDAVELASMGRPRRLAMEDIARLRVEHSRQGLAVRLVRRNGERFGMAGALGDDKPLAAARAILETDPRVRVALPRGLALLWFGGRQRILDDLGRPPNHD